MSLKQLAANRRNAVKSTGPKTPEGRAVSKMNAFKHGLTSREVLVRGINRRESGRELDVLHQRFWDDLQPVGPAEEMLVDQIVTAYWRLRRALTAESGEIVLSVDEGQWKRIRGPDPRLQWALWESFGDPIPQMQDSARGIDLLEHWVTEVRAAVEAEDELTEATVQRVVQHFGGKPNSLTRQLDELRAKLSENPEGLDEATFRERKKSEALKFLNQELTSLKWWKGECVRREESSEAARQAAAVLPSMEVLDKILRYETKLERQLYRAMAQLERRQRLRRGEAVPAPLSVEVSERD